MKVYTRTGDSGDTQLFGGQRVPKNDERVEAYGAVDEAIAALGVVAACEVGEQKQQIHHVQNRLFALGSTLASPKGTPETIEAISQQDVDDLEHWIDTLDATLPELHNFILPTGTPAAAQAHMARAVVRRAERRVVEFSAHEPVEPVLLKYLNRLSDALFVVARHLNSEEGDTPAAFHKRDH